MDKNKHNWELRGQESNVDKIREHNRKLQEQVDKGETVMYGGLGMLKESVTKSYKYIGPEYDGNIDVLRFNADAWKEVAQNQQSLF